MQISSLASGMDVVAPVLNGPEKYNGSHRINSVIDNVLIWNVRVA